MLQGAPGIQHPDLRVKGSIEPALRVRVMLNGEPFWAGLPGDPIGSDGVYWLGAGALQPEWAEGPSREMSARVEKETGRNAQDLLGCRSIECG